MTGNFVFTSEAGLRGHPDKVSDEIGDAILDAFLSQDEFSRVGCNVMVVRDFVLIGGQTKSNANVPIETIARNTIKNIGYTSPGKGFDYQTCDIIVRIDSQAQTISSAVDIGGAGDSGIMFGYACKDTSELMPLAPALAHLIAAKMEECWKNKVVEDIGPDGKVQVSIRYQDFQPVQVDNIVISVQHSESIDNEEYLRNILRKHVIDSIVPKSLFSSTSLLHVKPSLGFTVGGPKSDCGLSGRKVVADTYGGWCRNGGGGLSGKDPTKIDRCATYMARYIAKNIVAAGLADCCEVQIAYMFGYEEPVSLYLDFSGTGKVSEDKVIDLVRRIFPLSPASIIDLLDLRRPIYRKVGSYGHFGKNDIEFTWERTDKVDQILLNI